MKTLKGLVRGEFQRLLKYNIIQVSFGVSVLWLLILFLVGKDEVGVFLPLVIFMDLTMMSVLLMGVSLFYERQENTLKTLMVTPAPMWGIALSKVIASIYLAFQSVVVVVGVSFFAFDISFRLIPLLGFVLIISLAHGIFGFVLSLFSKDFNGLLALIMAYMVVFAFPSIFYALDLMSESIEPLLLISPTHVALLMIDYGFDQAVDTFELVYGTLYLLIGSVLLWKFLIIPLYPIKGVKE
ncbi:MAG: ABC transporter permease [Bacillota bacterium]